jgi:peptidyl-prolyl cis-trans isomerase B (cyclophilin B)
MKALYTMVAVVCILVLVMPQQAEAQEGKKTDAPKAKAADSVAVIQVEYDGKPLGNIVIKFFPELAPNHVANFKKLAGSGFYNGITFHRVIPNFMVQGGDPNTKNKDRSDDGFGDPGYKIKAEFSKKPHKRGIVSMARGTDPNSAGSQFFICVKDVAHLDGQYSVFGEVIEGMDVVDKIVGVPKDNKNNPLKAVVMKDVSIVSEGSAKKAKKK